MTANAGLGPVCAFAMKPTLKAGTRLPIQTLAPFVGNPVARAVVTWIAGIISWKDTAVAPNPAGVTRLGAELAAALGAPFFATAALPHHTGAMLIQLAVAIVVIPRNAGVTGRGRDATSPPDARHIADLDALGASTEDPALKTWPFRSSETKATIIRSTVAVVVVVRGTCVFFRWCN